MRARRARGRRAKRAFYRVADEGLSSVVREIVSRASQVPIKEVKAHADPIALETHQFLLELLRRGAWARAGDAAAVIVRHESATGESHRKRARGDEDELVREGRLTADHVREAYRRMLCDQPLLHKPPRRRSLD